MSRNLRLRYSGWIDLPEPSDTSINYCSEEQTQLIQRMALGDAQLSSRASFILCFLPPSFLIIISLTFLALPRHRFSDFILLSLINSSLVLSTLQLIYQCLATRQLIAHILQRQNSQTSDPINDCVNISLSSFKQPPNQAELGKYITPDFYKFFASPILKWSNATICTVLILVVYAMNFNPLSRNIPLNTFSGPQFADHTALLTITTRLYLNLPYLVPLLTAPSVYFLIPTMLSPVDLRNLSELKYVLFGA